MALAQSIKHLGFAQEKEAESREQKGEQRAKSTG
jgi:hypothetical protein